MAQWQNTVESYGMVAKTFHWTLALLAITMLAFGFWMGTQEPPLKFQLYGIHKATGVLILSLALCRLLWRVKNPNPALPADFPPALRCFVRLGHYALYAMLIAMPLIGWGMSSAAGSAVSFYGLFTLPPLFEANREWLPFFKAAHFWGAWLFIVMIAGHVLAALYHHFIRKDNVLRRMLPCSGKCI